MIQKLIHEAWFGDSWEQYVGEYHDCHEEASCSNILGIQCNEIIEREERKGMEIKFKKHTGIDCYIISIHIPSFKN